MSITDQGVEDRIRRAQSRKVIAGLRKRREDQARRVDPGELRVAREVGNRRFVLTQQPEHALRHFRQHPQPHGKAGPIDLVGLVESAEHHLVFGQAVGGPRGRVGGGEALVVVALVAVGETAELLYVVGRAAIGCHEPVGHDIVDRGVGRAAGEAYVGCLHRRRPEREHSRAAPAGVELQVEQDIQAIRGHARRSFVVAHRVDRHVMLDGIEEALPVLGNIRAAVVVGKDFETLPVVALEHASHEMHGRVVAEIAGQIAHTQALAGVACGVQGEWRSLRNHSRNVGARHTEIACFVPTPGQVR